MNSKLQNSAQNAPKVAIFRLKIEKISALDLAPPPVCKSWIRHWSGPCASTTATVYMHVSHACRVTREEIWHRLTGKGRVFLIDWLSQQPLTQSSSPGHTGRHVADTAADLSLFISLYTDTTCTLHWTRRVWPMNAACESQLSWLSDWVRLNVPPNTL